MARASASFRSAGAGSATLPLGSLYAVASFEPEVAEVHVFNTTTSALVVALVRLTTAGTQGAGLTEARFDQAKGTPQATAFNTHTGGPTITDELVRADVGAAIGAGVIWTFDAKPIRIPAGTANGLGIIVPSGTGQVCDIVFVWDE